MKRIAQHILFCAAFCYSLLACNVHQWPEHPIPEVDVYLTMAFDTKMDSLEIFARASEFASSNPDDYDVRHSIRAYYVKENGYIVPDSFRDTVIINKVAGGALDITEDDRVKWHLPPGKYKIFAWTDYVKNDSKEDLFYTTYDFTHIGLTTQSTGAPTVGNCEYRDAFSGWTEVEIEPQFELDLPDVRAHLDMSRPLAKFEFITNDLDEFVTRVLEKRAEEAAAAGGAAAAETITPASIDLNEFKIVIRYVGFMPSVYSMPENDPVDALANVSFNSSVVQIDKTTASLGFDYVFVHTDSSNIKLSISVYNNKNTLLSAVTDITVPIQRSRLTTIRGSFMTESAQGGVGIDPGFEGDIIYPVN